MIDTTPIDYAHLIDMMGGPEVVAGAMGAEDLKARTVYFWVRRNSVPGRYAAALIDLAIKRRVIPSIDALPRLDPFAPVA
jgi:hypothetical protein